MPGGVVVNARARPFAVAVIGSRIAYGAALLAAPERITKRWLGPARETDAARVALRALGAREVAIHALALAAALRGESLRPWLGASIAGDLSDIAATTASRSGLPRGSAPATAAVAGASAALSAAVLAAAGK
jgi:hypothetical protein